MASKNGDAIETIILGILGTRHSKLDVIDTVVDGIPIEIKSCQVKVYDKYAANGWRYGRFVFNDEQHDELLLKGGMYAFVVHDETNIVSTRLVPAERIENIFGRACSRVWHKVIDNGIKLHSQ